MAKEKENRNEDGNVHSSEGHIKKCGIIMPIADTVGYTPGHWNEVLSIICEAFEGTDFKPDLVSKRESTGLILESIVSNIYSNEIVVCDVSAKNPNVMFELGLRLAFDKPVIIIKDERTDYSFDTGPIEHLPYLSSLRFQNIVSFKKDLKAKALATYEASVSTPNYSPYLKSFKQVVVPGKIENIEVKDFQFLISSMNSIRSDINRLNSHLDNSFGDDFAQQIIESNRKGQLAKAEELSFREARYKRQIRLELQPVIDNYIAEGKPISVDNIVHEYLRNSPKVVNIDLLQDIVARYFHDNKIVVG